MPGGADVRELTSVLKRLTGASSVTDPKVVDLLRRWGASCGKHKKVLKQAVEGALPNWLDTVRQDAVDAYAGCLMGPERVVHLLVSLRAPKRAFRTLSEFFTHCKEPFEAATGLRFTRPLCSRRRFQKAWRKLLEPLELEAPKWVHTDRGPLVSVVWPLESWARYIAATPDLNKYINWDSKLLFIVRGDGYPTGGVEWCNLTISLANFGKHARSPAFLWLIGLAAGSEKEMDGLAQLWKTNLEVNTHLCMLAVSWLCELQK